MQSILPLLPFMRYRLHVTVICTLLVTYLWISKTCHGNDSNNYDHSRQFFQFMIHQSESYNVIDNTTFRNNDLLSEEGKSKMWYSSTSSSISSSATGKVASTIHHDDVTNTSHNDNDMRYIIKYKNSIGRDIALNASSYVYYEFEQDQYLVLDIVSNEQLIQLQQNEHIYSIEYDGIWNNQGYDLEDEMIIDITDESNKPIIEWEQKQHAGSSRVNIGEQIPYGIPIIQADQIQYNNSNRAVVCIVDSGVTTTHLDFDISLLNGINRISSYNKSVSWDTDIVGHGTCISGIINAKINNQYGIRGVGQIPIYMTRGLNDNGTARESDIRNSIEQCANVDGVRVINLSLAGSSITLLLQNIIDRLYDTKNMIFVAASGNDGNNIPLYPAAYKKVISVGAVNSSQLIWSRSNYGPHMEIVAPGTGIISLGITKDGTNRSKLVSYTGTSMATPYVSGGIAILLSHFPTCTGSQIRFALAYTAKDNGPIGCDEKYGYGIIQIKNAYDFLIQYQCTSTTNWGQNIGNGFCNSIDVLIPRIPVATVPTTTIPSGGNVPIPPTPTIIVTPILLGGIVPSPPTPTIIVTPIPSRGNVPSPPTPEIIVTPIPSGGNVPSPPTPIIIVTPILSGGNVPVPPTPTIIVTPIPLGGNVPSPPTPTIIITPIPSGGNVPIPPTPTIIVPPPPEPTIIIVPTITATAPTLRRRGWLLSFLLQLWNSVFNPN